MISLGGKLAEKGSQKWLQLAVNVWPDYFEELIRAQKPKICKIEWRSPLSESNYAEYYGENFLDAVGLSHLRSAMRTFWPSSGPRWDALATASKDFVLLVEAKAHLAELFSACKAGKDQATGKVTNSESRLLIKNSLAETSAYLNAKPKTPWTDVFYQYANRLAHLYFLRRNRINAYLVLADFIGCTDHRGPETTAEWQAAYKIVDGVLGLPSRHKLTPYILHVYPDVRKCGLAPRQAGDHSQESQHDDI